jgi:hypothetical protein
MDFQHESLAYNEKIHLAKVEVTKAQGRVSELEYQFARFQMEAYVVMQKEQQLAQQQAQMKVQGEGNGQHK